jgi:hypothetical protein
MGGLAVGGERPASAPAGDQRCAVDFDARRPIHHFINRHSTISERGVSIDFNFQNSNFRCSVALLASLSKVSDVEPDVSMSRRGVLSVTDIAQSPSSTAAKF